MAKLQPRPTNPYPLIHGPGAGRYPMSVGQERLWWLHQLAPENNQYHITAGWRLSTELDRVALSSALAGLARRHGVLRTRFVRDPNGTATQDVVDTVEIPVTWAGHDWRLAVTRAATEPFDLGRAPLLRVVVAQLADGHGIFVALHHIIADGWSIDVLARDLFELHAAACQGRDPRLPELPVQYGDYAAWQRRFLTDDVVKPQLDYWTGALAGFERLELPLDHPRTVSLDSTGKTVVLEVSEADTTALTAMAWRARVSPAMVVTAALVAVLGAFAGQSDVVIGAMVSDRPRPELQDLIGFFVNTVILRIGLSARALTFRDVVDSTRDAWMAAHAHQDAPLEQIVAAVHGGSGADTNPIFEVVVNHAVGRTGLGENPSAPAWWHPEVPASARFDLSLTTELVGARLHATFVYRSALFDEATMAALADRFARLLKQGVAEPDRPLRDLGLPEKPTFSRPQGLSTHTPIPESTVVERVQAQAAVRPRALAVIGSSGMLTYQELNASANRLARYLSSHGVGPEQVVGVCMERSAERILVLLAIAKAGGAYLPLDPDSPAERLRLLLNDAGAVLTIASPALRERVPPAAAPILVFSRDRFDLGGYAPENPPLSARPGNLAYLVSTSGSSGIPKSVAISHQALDRLVAGAPQWLDIGPGSRFLQTGALTFDVAVLEWAPLAHGGCVVAADVGSWLENLASVLRDCRVTTLKIVSAQLDLVVEQGSLVLANLRQLVVGGDVVNPMSFAAARDSLPGCRVTTSYGPTECTVLATVFDDSAWTGRVPIGYPIPDTQLYLLDRDLRPASVGMRAEIYLAGDRLARGYHARPDLTAAAFVPDPFGPPGSRMFRTGDMGRYLPNGAVDFLGRSDRQVKIRGFRIDPGEVEQALLRQADINSAVVVRRELETGPALVAYIVAAAEVDVVSLRQQLRAVLPSYLVPGYVIQLPRLPMTAHDKIDHTALPPVIVAESNRGDVPITGLEARVADAWSAVLGRAVPTTADFFDQGGHSLLVPKATATVRRLLGRDVPLRLMTQHRTPAAYAAALVRESLADLGAASREHRLEQRMWRGRAAADRRRVDLYISPEHGAAVPPRVLVVLDGSDFVDIMRLPSVLDRLVLSGQIPVTAAVFLSPVDWSSRRAELLDDALVDVLADELVPLLRAWLGGRPIERATALGVSLGAVTAIRAALRRPDCFCGAIALSCPLSEHHAGPSAEPARIFLSAGTEEEDLLLDDGLNLLAATTRLGKELASQGHTVRCEHCEGGHTYAAWEAILPKAVDWALRTGVDHGI